MVSMVILKQITIHTHTYTYIHPTHAPHPLHTHTHTFTSRSITVIQPIRLMTINDDIARGMTHA